MSSRPVPSVGILVVEDDDGQALLTTRALKKLGFNVSREATGQGCLDSLRPGTDQIVLLDLGLPDMHGLEVLEKVVARSAETPVIMVTGVDDLKIAVEAIQKGAWDYVVKRVDLSHLEELPHVIKRNQDRQRLVQERSLFLSMLSHDIKNPVQVILSYADILQEETVLNDEGLRFLERIKQNAESILRLVIDFVDVRKIEAGKLTINPQDVDFEKLLDDLIPQQAALAAQRQITLASNLVDGLPLVRADRQAIQRALTNLIGNAIKYTPEGGKVTVTATPGNGQVQIAISDTGQGIPADELPFIFEKFRRARGHGDAEGSGLGLFIVKALVEAHGGDIEVTSKEAEGSTFLLRFPVAPS